MNQYSLFLFKTSDRFQTYIKNLPNMEIFLVHMNQLPTKTLVEFMDYSKNIKLQHDMFRVFVHSLFIMFYVGGVTFFPSHTF